MSPGPKFLWGWKRNLTQTPSFIKYILYLYVIEKPTENLISGISVHLAGLGEEELLISLFCSEQGVPGNVENCGSLPWEPHHTMETQLQLTRDGRQELNLNFTDV